MTIPLRDLILLLVLASALSFVLGAVVMVGYDKYQTNKGK